MQSGKYSLESDSDDDEEVEEDEEEEEEVEIEIEEDISALSTSKNGLSKTAFSHIKDIEKVCLLFVISSLLELNTYCMYSHITRLYKLKTKQL